MKFSPARFALAITASWLICCPASAADASDRITVKPVEIDDVLRNPGIGWETFLRTAAQDKNLPAWIPSTIHYCRWGWGRLEPEPGRLNFGHLDRVLADTRKAGQKLAFRIMCCSSDPTEPYHPNWLERAGGKLIRCDYEGKGPLLIPDLEDPPTLALHLDFIRRLGQRYDGHSDIDHIDLGSIGWWGEWHLSGTKAARLPSVQTRRKVIDAYLAAFTKTKLVMLLDEENQVAYATSKGTGWRADCLGDLGGFSASWCHMRKGYPKWITEAKIQDAWKYAPVAFESCWDLRKWVKENWSLRYIFNYALALHASCFNNKSAPLPENPELRPELERFLRRLGYRFVLRELSFPAIAAPGGQLAVNSRWQNVGSAPCYRPYRLAYRLRNPAGQAVFIGKTTVDRWMPGSVELFTPAFLNEPPDLPPGEIAAVTDRIALPPDMPPGEYQLSIAVVGETIETPVLRLAIQDRDEDGWYRLGRLWVARP